jgi:chorismate mutase
MSQASSDLANRRAEIDRIDREMQHLLQARAKVVQGVLRAKKAATAAGEVTPPFRPGREAEVLRTLLGHHSGDFPAASLLRIWREIMSGATRIQAVQRIVVAGGCGAVWDLARDHFGLGAEYDAVADASEAFAVLKSEGAAAAVVPMPSVTGAGAWWRDLLQSGTPEGAPQVVARLPFFQAGTTGEAMVLTPFAPDESSRDRGILGLTLSPAATTGAVMGWVEGAGLTLAGEPLLADCHAWAEVEGLIAADAPALASLTATPGIVDVRVLGGYAVPLA